MSKALIKELRTANTATLASARSLLNDVKDDTPAERAADLEKQHDTAMDEYRAREVKIERLEGIEAAEARAAAHGDTENRNRRPHPGDENAPTGDVNPLVYRDVFRKAIQHGVAELTPEERTMFVQNNRGGASPEERALATTSGATGGYLIPQDMLPEIDKAMAEWSPMMDGDVTRQMLSSRGNPVTAPTVDYTAQRGTLHTEGGATTDDGTSDPAIGQKILNAYIYKSGIVRVSIEMLQDSDWDMEAMLNELFGESLGQTCNAVLTLGDGTAKPEGILTFAGTGKTATATGALIGDELIDLQHSVLAPYRKSPKCRWQFNDTTLGTVRKLKDGDGNYLWQEANIRAGEPSTLLGHRYEINPDMPNIGVADSPVLFGDHGKFIVRKVGSPGMIVFREKYMNELEVGFMAYRRVDGAGLNGKALKKLTMAAS